MNKSIILLYLTKIVFQNLEFRINISQRGKIILILFIFKISILFIIRIFILIINQIEI